MSSFISYNFIMNFSGRKSICSYLNFIIFLYFVLSSYVLDSVLFSF